MKLEDLNAKILKGLEGQAKADFIAGLEKLNMDNPADRDALEQSIRRLRPDFTPEQIEIFVSGKVKSEADWNLTEAIIDQEREDFIARIATAYRELNPGASEEDVAKWTQDNEKRVKAKSEEEDYSTATVSQLVSAVLQDDKDKAEAQEIPDALAARHPDWSPQTKEAWLKKNESLLLAFKGLHPEWSGSQLVTAVDDNPEGK